MPSDITLFDLFAFVWFVAVWLGYSIAMDWLQTRIPGINQRMRRIRVCWMERLLERENRIYDSQLIGHTIASVTFFASTSVLVIAGLLGVLGAADAAWRVVSGLGLAVQTSKEFFELKLLLLVVIFIYGFLKFTWALRQYNYTCALLGAAPLEPVAPDSRRALAKELAMAVNHAITAFNGGLRAYYFALAALTWFIQPWLFVLATGGVAVLLVRRQVWSGFSDTVGRAARLLDGHEERI